MFTLTYCLDPHLEKKIVKFIYTTHLVHHLMGHLMVIIGHLRVTIGHLKVTIGHLRVIMGHLKLAIGYP